MPRQAFECIRLLSRYWELEEVRSTVMGISVYCGTREVWAPSQAVGILYWEQVQALERAFRVKSGVQSPNVEFADELQIDAEVFGEFLNTVLRALQETNNGPLLGLSAGCIEVSLALNAYITGDWPTVPEGLEFLLAEAKNVMRLRKVALPKDRIVRNWTVWEPEDS